MSSWKAAQSKREALKKTKFALIALSIFFGIIIFARIVKFTQILFSPWQIKTEKSFSWDGEFNINVAVRSDEGISLFSFSPKNQKVTIIKLPDETYLEVAGGFGKWQLRSVFNLGGYKLLENTLSGFFGLPIDGYIEGDLKEKENIVSFLISVPNIKTDLKLVDLIRLKLGVSNIRFDKVKEIDLKASELMRNETLADGTKVLIADPAKLDFILSEAADPQIQSEHQTIAIFNATDHPLLAQKAARLIANMGGDVIIITNSQKKYKKTLVSGEKSKTLERLKQIFVSSDKIEPNLEDLDSSRAQINLFLGEDYFDKL